MAIHTTKSKPHITKSFSFSLSTIEISFFLQVQLKKKKQKNYTVFFTCIVRNKSVKLQNKLQVQRVVLTDFSRTLLINNFKE